MSAEKAKTVLDLTALSAAVGRSRPERSSEVERGQRRRARDPRPDDSIKVEPFSSRQTNMARGGNRQYGGGGRGYGGGDVRLPQLPSTFGPVLLGSNLPLPDIKGYRSPCLSLPSSRVSSHAFLSLLPSAHGLARCDSCLSPARPPFTF